MTYKKKRAGKIVHIIMLAGLLIPSWFGVHDAGMKPKFCRIRLDHMKN
jgi:hypothetical protein